MSRKILKLIFILLLSIALLTLTGCEDEKVEEIKQNHSVIRNEVKKEDNKVAENISENIIENTTVVENSVENEIISSDIEDNSRNEVENDTTNVVEETKQENDENTTDKEEVPIASKFNVGRFEFNYGIYETTESEMVDLRMEFASITIDLKQDGTYILKSDNQTICEDCSGSWIISGDSILLNKTGGTVEYKATGDNLFVGNGSYTLSYVE